MLIQTKFLRLHRPVALGDRLDGWRGGWDRGQLMVMLKTAMSGSFTGMTVTPDVGRIPDAHYDVLHV